MGKKVDKTVKTKAAAADKVKAPVVVAKPKTVAPVDVVEEVVDAAELTALQIKERKSRTVFVGNLSMNITAKKLQKLFRACGKIDKIWFRSICVTEESKKSKRAKIITKEYGEYKDSKNAYILYSE